jgi:Cu-Zn family superoxide dismutase
MKKIVLLSLLLIVSCSFARSLTVTFYRSAKKDQGPSIGTVTFKDTLRGLLIQPKLHGLKPGLHGFHIHQNPSCDNLGMAAGGHYDPYNTGKHLGPYDSQGHLGDMPALYVNAKGRAIHPEFAPRLHVQDLYHHAIMIHEGGDNYSDTPEQLGGGGARVACAVVMPLVKKVTSKK